MKEKVFAIGLNQTGSTSLHEALQALGLRSLHDHEEATTICLALRSGRIPEALHHLDAVLDFRDPPFVELAAAFPNARFILNTRCNKADWINSRIVDVLFNRISRPQSPWQDINTIQWSQLWDWHHKRVREFFARLRSVKYLELDIPAGDGWEILCPFLGCGIPPIPFPNDNQSNDHLRVVLQAFDGKAAKRWAKTVPVQSIWNAENAMAFAEKIPGWMSRGELNWLYRQAQDIEPGETWVEVGSYCGRSLFCVAVGLPTTAKLVSIDSSPLPELERIGEKIREAKPDIQLELFTKKSLEAASDFGKGTLAMVFIDAAHDADSVEKDTRTWWDLVKPGGVLAGHDHNWPSVREGLARAGIPPVQTMTGGSIWWIEKPL